MTIDKIHLFILTAKYLNISQSARELRISQSTASRQLKQFQQDLETTLLKKCGRGIELTKSGRIFLDEVSPIFSQLEALQQRYIRNQQSLTVAGSHGISTYLLPSLMTEFGKKYPSATLTLHTSNSSEVEELLLASKVDVAIVTNPTITSSFFTLEPCRREPLTAFIAVNHPLAQKESAAWSGLGVIPLVVRIRRDGQSRTQAQLKSFAKTGLKFKIVLGCESPESVKEAVRRGAGVGILYHDVIKRELDRGEFKAVKIPGFDVVGQSYIVYSKEKPLSALAREFLSLLRASVMQNPPIKAKTQQVPYGRTNGHARDQLL